MDLMSLSTFEKRHPLLLFRTCTRIMSTLQYMEDWQGKLSIALETFLTRIAAFLEKSVVWSICTKVMVNYLGLISFILQSNSPAMAFQCPEISSIR